jgi:large subunit ribosomal protein L13
MKTYMAKPATVERKWYVVDAEGQPLGRVASQVAAVLRGKNKPTFTPNVDTGDYVIIINCAGVMLTGDKLNQKMYRHHSGYVGGLKEKTAKDVMNSDPCFAMRQAIKGMLPKNALGRKMFKKLFVYAGAEHKQQAQKPEALELVQKSYNK